jgi:ribosomal protein S17E
MQRRATSIADAEVLTKDEFQQRAFFNVNEVDNGYLDMFGNWQKSPNMKTLVRDDGSYIQSVGKRYQFMSNEKLFNDSINVLTESGIEWEPKNLFLEGNGLRTIMVVKLPQFTIFKGDTKEEQVVELKIINPLDRINAIHSILGMLKLICTNGMKAFVKDFDMKVRHSGNIFEKVTKGLELYQNFQETVDYNKRKIEWMAETKGTRNGVANYIGNGEESLNGIFKGPRWAKKLQEKWEAEGSPTDLWSIYNIFTYIISHEFGHDYSKKLQAMDKLTDETSKWTRLMDVKSKGFSS